MKDKYKLWSSVILGVLAVLLSGILVAEADVEPVVKFIVPLGLGTVIAAGILYRFTDLPARFSNFNLLTVDQTFYKN